MLTLNLYVMFYVPSRVFPVYYVNFQSPKVVFFPSLFHFSREIPELQQRQGEEGRQLTSPVWQQATCRLPLR